jgi:hypothetical protein
VATVSPERGLEGEMPDMTNVVRIFIVLVLTFGLATSAAGMASAQDITGDAKNDIHHGLTTDELVEQLVQILKDILSEILGGGDSLADLLPSQCAVTVTGFNCDLSGGNDPDFTGFVTSFCIQVSANSGICTIGGVEFSCVSAGPSTTFTCTAP